MRVKSDWGGWLLLASVIVFPSMLYVTQPLATHELDRPVGSVTEKNHPEIATQFHRERLANRVPIEVVPSENSNVQWLESEQDQNSAEMSEVNDDEPDASGSFVALGNMDDPVTSGRAVPVFTRLSFANSGGTQQQSRNTIATAAASDSLVDETAVVAETTIASDNAYLYLAETTYSPAVNENKCPPVYMELNSYARNMRSAMGCDNK